MASRIAIAIMREQALQRLSTTVGRLLGAHGLEASPYDNLARDPDESHAATLWAVAGDLERLEAAQDAAKDVPKGKAKA